MRNSGRTSQFDSDDELSKKASFESTPKATDKKSIELETKLNKSIEMATQQCSKTRIIALQQIANILLKVYKPELIMQFRITLLDILKKAIKHGNKDEQIVAAQIVPMLILQIDNSEDVIKAIIPLLTQVVFDNTSPSVVRTKFCLSVTVAQFLVDASNDNSLQLMQQLENIFSGCFSTDHANEDENELYCTALHAWGLLLTRMRPAMVVKLFNRGGFLL